MLPLVDCDSIYPATLSFDEDEGMSARSAESKMQAVDSPNTRITVSNDQYPSVARNEYRNV